ncbi:TetR/AcrR family transcriptional regulator [Magnetospirillum fulvum]|jgi:TetR/AcrR family transcriptional repressor of mexJK operon|uniref:Transcriptional regulator, TetR family n=1 Tax=Magnetospirillum fulvum TaxID=1082 RepID=A0A1H6GZW7_MAGFU|nr:TetR/AcrR family transcriptional regulator [Magnetospirillum fulvum]SEH27373.1 transcriptional regulator, TetR family [Magnetospirillum fulvum]
MTESIRCPRPSAKRDAILDAARAVFLEVGYAAASMDNVAARAGVSKATIYAHFTGKDDLFGAVIRLRCDRNLTFTSVDPGLDARATLTVVGHRLMDLLLQPDTLAMYRLVTAEAHRQPDLARAFYESGPGTGKGQIAQVLLDLSRRGLLTVEDAWQMADLFTGMLRTDLFMRTMLGLPQPEDGTVDKAVSAAVETMLRAFAP